MHIKINTTKDKKLLDVYATLQGQVSMSNNEKKQLLIADIKQHLNNRIRSAKMNEKNAEYSNKMDVLKKQHSDEVSKLMFSPIEITFE